MAISIDRWASSDCRNRFQRSISIDILAALPSFACFFFWFFISTRFVVFLLDLRGVLTKTLLGLFHLKLWNLGRLGGYSARRGTRLLAHLFQISILHLGKLEVERPDQRFALNFQDDGLVVDSTVDLELLEKGTRICAGQVMGRSGLSLLVAIGVGLEVGAGGLAVESAQNHFGVVFIFVHASSNLNC